MLKIFFKKIFIFRVAKQTQKRKGWKSQKKEKLLFLIPEKIGDRKLSECKTIK